VRSEIEDAADFLSLYHEILGIPINHLTLAKTLGVSKSTMYRTYKSVGSAIKRAKRFVLRTQYSKETIPEELNREAERLLSAACEQDNSVSVGAECSVNIEDVDLPWSHLYNAAIELRDNGKRVSKDALQDALRKNGTIPVNKPLVTYYNETDIRNAIRAAA